MQIDKLIEARDVRGFFQESVIAVIENHKLAVSEDTTVYVINLLTEFVRSDRFYDQSPDGYTLRPLALLYGDAIHAQSDEQRIAALRRLGDVALFVAGLFADSLRRKSVDIDYYISMGGTAYGHLSDTLGDTVRGRSLTAIFRELSDHFTDLVDVLGEVNDQAEALTDIDILRLYEVWTMTGSKRAARRLHGLGIQLSEGALAEPKH